MNKIRIILGYLFGLITTLLLVILAFLLVYKFTIGDKDYVLDILEKDHYYAKLDTEIKEEMSLEILSTGFNEDILKDVYSFDQLVLDVKEFINSAYNGKVVELDTTSIEEAITSNVNTFFKDTKQSYVEKDVKAFIDELVNVYRDEVMLYHFTDSIINYIPKINNYINKGILIGSILLIILIIILVVIKYKYYGATIMASGLIILFIRLFIFERIDATDILIITENFSEELRIILVNLQEILFMIPIILIIVGFILSIMQSLMSSQKK